MPPPVPTPSPAPSMRIAWRYAASPQIAQRQALATADLGALPASTSPSTRLSLDWGRDFWSSSSAERRDSFVKKCRFHSLSELSPESLVVLVQNFLSANAPLADGSIHANASASDLNAIPARIIIEDIHAWTYFRPDATLSSISRALLEVSEMARLAKAVAIITGAKSTPLKAHLVRTADVLFSIESSADTLSEGPLCRWLKPLRWPHLVTPWHPPGAPSTPLWRVTRHHRRGLALTPVSMPVEDHATSGHGCTSTSDW